MNDLERLRWFFVRNGGWLSRTMLLQLDVRITPEVLLELRYIEPHKNGRHGDGWKPTQLLLSV